MDIKVSAQGIYKRIPENIKSSIQLNDLLQDRLDGDKNIFAGFSSANGYYIWTLPGNEWQKLTSADGNTAINIRSTLESRKADIRKIFSASPVLSPDQVELILSVPSDDYVYYQEDPLGNISVMLVAWDYQLSSRQVSGSGRFKGKPEAPRQGVELHFIEAGKPVAEYPILIKGQGGKFMEKKADASGVYNLPKLPIGKMVEIMSTDKLRDFSFTVAEGQSILVHDLTGPVAFEVHVTKDGGPCQSVPVHLTYSGQEFPLCTDTEGFARCHAEFHENSEVIAQVDSNVQNQIIEYPVTKIRFDLHSAIAQVTVTCLKNGEPSAGEKVIINVPGFNTVVRATGPGGVVEERMKLHEDAEVAVSVCDETQRQPMGPYNEFRFERLVPVNFSPVITVKDQDGNAVPEYPVSVTAGGKTDSHVTAIDGTICLHDVQDRQVMAIQDGKVPGNIRTYELDSRIPGYEFIVALPQMEYYNVFLKCNNSSLPAGISASLQQNGGIIHLEPDTSGLCHVRKDDIESGKPVVALFNMGDRKEGRIDVVFSREEDDYEININLKKRVYVWDVFKQILVALLTAFFFWVVLIFLLVLVIP